jgi:hypothetical protein
LLSLFEAKPDCWCRIAFRTIKSSAAWTENRHKCFSGITTDHTIGLNSSKAGLAGIALVTLWSLHALDTLWPLRPCRTLGTGFSLWPGGTWHLLASSECNGRGHDERYHDLLHFQIPRTPLFEH